MHRHRMHLRLCRPVRISRPPGRERIETTIVESMENGTAGYLPAPGPGAD